MYSISLEKESSTTAATATLSDAEIQFDVDVQILLICAKSVLHLALVGACIVFAHDGDNVSNANLVSIGTYYGLLRYRTAKTVWCRFHLLDAKRREW